MGMVAALSCDGDCALRPLISPLVNDRAEKGVWLTPAPPLEAGVGVRKLKLEAGWAAECGALRSDGAGDRKLSDELGAAEAEDEGRKDEVALAVAGVGAVKAGRTKPGEDVTVSDGVAVLVVAAVAGRAWCEM